MIVAEILAVAALFSGTTTGRPLATGPTCTCGPPSSPQAVVSWTATGSGTATATTCPETTYDSILSVDSPLAEVACSDDTDSTHSCSTVSWAVSAGSTWTLAVTGCRGSAGPYTLHVTGPDVAQPGPACWPDAAWGRGQAACVLADYATLCKCSDSMTWGPVADIDRYEIFERIPGGTWKQVWTNWIQPAWIDEDGVHPMRPPSTLWIYAKGPVYAEGTLMEYGVRACKAGLCSTGITPIQFRWPPYEVIP